MIEGVVLYFSATTERIVAKGSATAENIAVKSSNGEKVLSFDHRCCGVFVHCGTATAENIVTRYFATMENTVTSNSATVEDIMIKGSDENSY